MAEVEIKKTGKKKTFNKKSTRVDLTPMVDLGFLLLTFFVFTTSMAEPKAMDLVMPYDKGPVEPDPVCESCALTVLLDKNNRITYYEGGAQNNQAIKQTGYGASGIRAVLMNKKEKVKKQRGTDQFILIIKPSAASNFKNFVDITDEVTICGIKKYYIDEIKPIDKKMLGQE